MTELKKKNIVSTMKAVCFCSLIGWTSMANATESSVSVRHLANEQNIVLVKGAKKYLLLPIQDNAPEGKVCIVVDNQYLGVAANVRLARDKVDYYVSFDLSAYEGKDISIDIQGMPESSLC